MFSVFVLHHFVLKAIVTTTVCSLGSGPLRVKATFDILDNLVAGTPPACRLLRRVLQVWLENLA